MSQNQLVYLFEAGMAGEEEGSELLPNIGEHILLLLDEKYPLSIHLIDDVGEVLLEYGDVDHPELPEVLECVHIIFIEKVVVP